MPVYSLEVPNSARPNEGKGTIRRAISPWNAALGVDGVLTLYEGFQRGLSLSPNDPCIGWRRIDDVTKIAQDFVWLTYKQTASRIDNFGSGLTRLGLCPPNDKNLKVIGFYAKNRPEWVVGEQGCYRHGYVPVPMYDTLGAESVAYVANQVELTTVVCSEAKLDNVLEATKKCPKMKNIILMDATPERLKAKAKSFNMKLYSFLDIETIGAGSLVPPSPPSPKDIAFFCYTSGTTGNPKGALITHQGIISAVAAIKMNGVDIGPSDVYLSYLPLPHVMERSCQFTMYFGGGRVGFYQGETLKIMEDIQALQPTLFVSVPRLLNRVYDKITQGVEEAGGVKARLFHQALASKTRALRSGAQTHPLWDRLVFNPLKARIGLGNVRMLVTGSAPISAHVMDFLRVVFGVPVVEGYGQTESSVAITTTNVNDFTSGHVGPPLSVNEVRLVDVPEMNYLTTDVSHGADSKSGHQGIPCLGRGEICFRGPNVFAGYYKMPEKTKETIDEEGWCHTGDIGIWQIDGNLRIVDRKKNIFKLSQGEYVAAEKIENIMARSSFVAMSFVHGDSLQSKLVAIVVPDQEYLEDWAKKNGFGGSYKEVCQNLKVVQIILEDMKKQGKLAKLKGFEFPKAIYVEPEPFSPENGLLTPTFKLKRPKVRDHYRKRIDILYNNLEQAQGVKSKL